jgi:hypothetical protein
MKFLALAVAIVAATVFTAGSALAQDKPTVTRYLEQGYQVIHAESGGQFMQFILRKDNQLVWCSVLIQDGTTTSCRTVK